jgi:hypothetical protein
MAIIQILEISTEERCFWIKLYAINWIVILDMYWVVHSRVYNTTEKDNPLRVVVAVMLWVRILIKGRWTTLFDKVCQWLATGRWFSPGPPVSSTKKNDGHDITEISLKVASNTIKQTDNPLTLRSGFMYNIQYNGCGIWYCYFYYLWNISSALYLELVSEWMYYHQMSTFSPRSRRVDILLTSNSSNCWQ